MNITSVIRKDFPILTPTLRGKPLVYLDSAATSLKPVPVIQAVREYYESYSANVFRGIYQLSERATENYENARAKVAGFIHAGTPDEVVFTRNTTESINILAAGFAHMLSSTDEIAATIMEHHSNFVPWQQIALKSKAKFKILGLTDDYKLKLSNLDNIITRKTKLFTITAVSNVLGIINPVQKIVAAVKRINRNCMVIVDAAQAAAHGYLDVAVWGADAVAFSGHKMLGPTGIGVLWAKSDLLEILQPYQYGGEMISEVRADQTVFKKPPHKFEAGTPHIAGAIGLGAAVDYISNVGIHDIRMHEESLVTYTLNRLKNISDLNVLGPQNSNDRGCVIAFTLKNIHPHDIAQVLAEENICIRAGHHCAMPLHDLLKLTASARISFYLYTTTQDIDAFILGLEKVKRIFA